MIFLFRDRNFLGLELLVRKPPSRQGASGVKHPIFRVICSTISSKRELVLTKRKRPFWRTSEAMKSQAFRMQMRVLSESMTAHPTSSCSSASSSDMVFLLFFFFFFALSMVLLRVARSPPLKVSLAPLTFLNGSAIDSSLLSFSSSRVFFLSEFSPKPQLDSFFLIFRSRILFLPKAHVLHV
ncbi:unnamed protein product, partial [Vitis vinifera]